MESWEKWYLQAQKYYQKHGNLNVPSNYVDNDGMKLGRWLNHQRAKYRGTDSHNVCLSVEQIEKLEQLGIVWDKLDQSWNDYYLSAKRYFEKTGDLLIPIGYIDDNGLKTGQWISIQRQYYFGKSKRGTISEDRIKKLESINMVWNPLVIQWEKSFRLVEQFYLEKGHLCIPKGYRVGAIDLAAWVRNQRSKYHHHGDGSLTVDQISRLENIGMIWNPYDEEWTRYFLIAKEFYTKNGNLLVPLRYIAEDGTKLGAWISRQRKKEKRDSGSLSDEQKQKLNSIKMIWDPNEAHFEECFAEARDYYHRVGDLEVDNTYISPSGMKLGIWVANLRRTYKTGNLSEAKKIRLEEIGMLWEVKNSPSQTSYPEQIVLFYLRRVFEEILNRYTELGFELDIFIPKINVAVEYDGAAWHKNKKDSDNQKNLLCKENGIQLFRLREENCPELNGISIDINVGKYSIPNVIRACGDLFAFLFAMGYIDTLPEINYDNDIGEIRKYYRNAKNESWDTMYNAAEQFYLEHGNLGIPLNYVTSDGLQLGTWITNQRANYSGYSGTGIDAYRIELLEKIGMIWSVPDSRWKIGYDEAKKYYEKFGDLHVNVSYVTDSGYNLGVWIRSQRKKESLTEEQIELLEEIGMIWSVFDEKWEKGFEEAKNFYAMCGQLRVPAGFVTDSEFALGNWIATQRSRYFAINGEKKLSDEQIIRLEEIGMVWDIAYDKWQQGFLHAKEYFDEFGDLLVPNKYVCSDGFPLGSWIQSRRCGYNGIGSWAKPSVEQIKKLEQIGMVWDVEDYYWKKNYLVAKEYYLANGNLSVAKRYVTEDGVNIGLWIQRQRRMHAEKTTKGLSDERIKMLNDIGMIW